MLLLLLLLPLAFYRVRLWLRAQWDRRTLSQTSNLPAEQQLKEIQQAMDRLAELRRVPRPPQVAWTDHARSPYIERNSASRELQTMAHRYERARFSGLPGKKALSEAALLRKQYQAVAKGLRAGADAPKLSWRERLALRKPRREAMRQVQS